MNALVVKLEVFQVYGSYRQRDEYTNICFNNFWSTNSSEFDVEVSGIVHANSIKYMYKVGSRSFHRQLTEQLT